MHIMNISLKIHLMSKVVAFINHISNIKILFMIIIKESMKVDGK